MTGATAISKATPSAVPPWRRTCFAACGGTTPPGRLVEWHDRNIPRTDQGLRRALRDLGEADLRRLLAVKRADNLAQAHQDLLGEIGKAEMILDRLLAEGACVSLKQLAVDGRDLTALGLRGPAVGQVLCALLDAVVGGDLANDRTALLERAQTLLPNRC